MDRAFLVKKDSDYYNTLMQYKKDRNNQIDFINNFFNENDIETVEYMISGTGKVNACFREDQKKDIVLKIIPTKNDFEKFQSQLKKANSGNIYSFKKSSAINKKLAQACVDNEIIVNLYFPTIDLYFKSLGRYGREVFENDGNFYLKISSDNAESHEIPDGFEEIKLSTYYLIKESQ